MNNQPHNDSHSSNWELLGELELPLNDNQNFTIHEWLDPILSPLQVHQDIFRRVETSLQEAGRRARDTHTERKYRHIHLKIYLPVNRELGRNWSFFRVEKMGDHSMNKLPADHAIELYLYVEPR